MLFALLWIVGWVQGTAVDFSHRTILDHSGHFQLEWRPEKETITFRVTVRTLGYVGLGFSPSGGMHGADIALAWVGADGVVHLTDRKAVGNHAPYLDRSQDLRLEGGSQNETHTVVQFSRLWRTCDSEDLELGADTVRLIWAYSDQDPADYHVLPYHSVLRRGSKSIHLAEPPADTTPLPVHKTWDIHADNLLLPEDDHTHYWCRIYRAPDLDRIVD